MKVTVYHNPRCSKSRQVLALLRDSGIEPAVVEYLKSPLGPADLEALFARLGFDDVRHALRTGEAAYRELTLGRSGISRTALIAAVAENPILLERPIVEGPNGTAVCRPAEKVLELIGPAPRP